MRDQNERSECETMKSCALLALYLALATMGAMWIAGDWNTGELLDILR